MAAGPASELAGLCAGDVVRARFSDGQWYLGTVEEDNGDGTYTLAWFDGDDAERVKARADLRLTRYDPEAKAFCDIGDEERAGIPKSPADEEGRVEVRVRHPFQEGEVSVSLPRHAKFKHVKKGLAKALGTAGGPNRGELMRRERGRYRGYKDAAYIGDVREVLATSSDFARCGGGLLAASLDDGEVSMDDEYIELRRARSSASGSGAGAPADGGLAPGARVELVSGTRAGSTGTVVELLGSSGMLTLRLEGSKLVHAAKVADCRPAELQDQAESPEELVARLMRIKEEPSERYTSALEALQLRPGASDAEIARQYRRLSMRIHPDKCSLPDASAAFQVLVRAHLRVKGQRGPEAGRPADPEPEDLAAGVEDGLTLRRALALLGDLRTAFAAPDFKSKLDTLEFQRDCYSGTAEYLKDRNALFATVHGVVLPRHGFEGSPSGVYKMLSQMAEFAESEEFRGAAAELNELVGVDLLPKRWDRVAKSCKRHLEAESKPPAPPQSRSYCGLLLGDAPRGGAPGGLLALAGRAGAQPEPKAPPAPEEAPGPLPWPADRSPPFRLFIAGSWSEYRPEAMRWESGLFVHQVVVSAAGTERFHLLKNGSEEGALYPDREDASPYEGFDIQGPDDEGYGLNWQIGKFAEEQVKQRSRVVVVVALDDRGVVRTVDWQLGQLSPPAGKARASGVKAAAEDCALSWEAKDGNSAAWDLDSIGA